MFPWFFVWAPQISPHFYWWIDSSNESLIRTAQAQQQLAKLLQATATDMLDATSKMAALKNQMGELQALPPTDAQ
jgi:hypothetical protein